MQMSSVRHQVLAREWQQRILEQQSSGLSVRRWCSEQKIVESKYYYWLQILRNEELTIRQPSAIFAPLHIAKPVEPAVAAVATAGICTIIRSRDLSVEIHNGADPQTMAAVMRALGMSIQ